MLKIVRQRLEASFSPEEARAISAGIAGKFPAIISEIRKDFYKKLDISVEEEPPRTSSGAPLAGDFFVPQKGVIFYYIIPDGKDFVEAGAVSRFEIPSGFNDFCSALENVIVSAGARLKGGWQHLTVKKEIVELIKEHSHQIHPDEKEIKASKELENFESRNILNTVLNAENLLLNKLTEVFDRHTIESAAEKFQKMGLLTRDYVVFCRKTGQQILRVASKAAIEESSQKFFKCYICGNPISDERLDEVVSVTPFCRKLLERNHWLIMRLHELLGKSGVKSEDIYIHSDSGSNIQNIFLIIDNLLFLLSACERKISLNDAFAINAHIGSYKISDCIVVSLEKTPHLMKSHLVEANKESTFIFLDSLADLENRIKEILESKEKALLREIFAPFTPLTSVNVQEIILGKALPYSREAEKEQKEIKEVQEIKELPAVQAAYEEHKKKSKKEKKRERMEEQAHKI